MINSMYYYVLLREKCTTKVLKVIVNYIYSIISEETNLKLTKQTHQVLYKKFLKVSVYFFTENKCKHDIYTYPSLSNVS